MSETIAQSFQDGRRRHHRASFEHARCDTSLSVGTGRQSYARDCFQCELMMLFRDAMAEEAGMWVYRLSESSHKFVGHR
jgi:hypothetical protein